MFSENTFSILVIHFPSFSNSTFYLSVLFYFVLNQLHPEKLVELLRFGRTNSARIGFLPITAPPNQSIDTFQYANIKERWVGERMWRRHIDLWEALVLNVHTHLSRILLARTSSIATHNCERDWETGDRLPLRSPLSFTASPSQKRPSPRSSSKQSTVKLRDLRVVQTLICQVHTWFLRC